MTTSSRSVIGHVVDFAWRSWVELGVSGWGSGLQSRCIDPEALLLLTGSLGDADPRLRDESLDWCSSYGHLLSRSRTRTLLKSWPAARRWPAYAGALEVATRQRWPAAEPGDPFTPTGKSRLSLEGRPSLLGVRLRSVLGVGARAEVMRILVLAGADSWLSVSEIAEEAAYTKRHVADALRSLDDAGLVDAARLGSMRRYRLSRRSEVESLFGPVPDIRFSYAAVARVAWSIADKWHWLGDAPDAVKTVELQSLVKDNAGDLWRAGARTSELQRALADPDALDGWIEHVLGELIGA
jgi:DNA-binding transcriptional ArsR family regulator